MGMKHHWPTIQEVVSNAIGDITFTSFKPVVYPRMMDGMWT